MATGISGFLVSPSVTLNTGTKTILVTGSVDCSYVVSGTAVILDGGGIFLEGVDGTNYDLNGDSTITLRETYNGPTLTDVPMTAFNTTEGLRDAIRRAREVTQNNVEIQGSFETLLTSTTPTVTIPVSGVDTEFTPYQYLANQVLDLIDSAENADAILNAVVQDVDNLQVQVDGLEATVDGKIAEATAQADIATDAANTATNQAGIATTQANTATTQAGIATTQAGNAEDSATDAASSESVATIKASEALTSANNAATSETNAANSEAEATTQAGIATTKANEASQSAADAAADAQAAETSRLQAATSEANAANSAVESENYSDISAANANFKGEWSSLSGPLSVPASVKHLDSLYILLNNLADVTSSEPAGDTNPDWAVIGTISSTAPDSERLGGETALEWQVKIDNVERARQFEDHLLNVELNSTSKSLFYATTEQLKQQHRIKVLEDKEVELTNTKLPEINQGIQENENSLTTLQQNLLDTEDRLDQSIQDVSTEVSQLEASTNAKLDELEALALAGL